MTQLSVSYAVCLYELSVPREDLKETQRLITEVPEIMQVLTSPVTRLEQKQACIDRIFPETVRNFLKVLCRHHDEALLPEILMAYEKYYCEQEHILKADLRFVERPSEEQLQAVKKKLCGLYGTEQAEVSLTEDKSLIGGFVIRAGDFEQDWSIAGRLRKLGQTLNGR